MITLFVVAFLYKDDKVLLIRRKNQTFGQGLYSMVGGKVEQNETALQAIKREVNEESSLSIPEPNFELVHTLHRKSTETELILLCFKADISNLPAPVNNEPEKHDEINFFKIDQLPKNIIPAHRQAIECIVKNIRYSEHGWQD